MSENNMRREGVIKALERLIEQVRAVEIDAFGLRWVAEKEFRVTSQRHNSDVCDSYIAKADSDGKVATMTLEGSPGDTR